MKCHCGRPLHYVSPIVRRIVEAMIATHGEFVRVYVNGRTFSVPRHYIALHGLKAEQVPTLGFEELPQ